MDTVRSEGSVPRWWVVLAGAAVVLEFVLLALWQRNAYEDFSDGVYLLSSREWLHGLALYRAFAAAQPPPVYLVGAGMLWVRDGLAAARVGLGLIDLATASLVGIAVWRTTGRPALVTLAVLAAPLLPISLHEHSQLIPETLAAPLLLGACLTCTRRDRLGACALLLALACACKVAFVLPAVAVVAASPHRRWLGPLTVAIAAVLAGASLLAFGGGLWRGAVQAQLQVGRTSASQAAGLIAQGAWNELPLVLLAIPALALVRGREATPEVRALVTALAACAGAGLLLVFTVLKRGSYIDVLAVAEPPLLVLAVCGADQVWRRRPALCPLALLVAAWLAAQSVSLLVSPGDPWAATRPLAASGLRWSASPATVDRLTRAARACPPGRAYGGAPYIAFLARRRAPGHQADTFITAAAPINARFARRAAADVPTCPAP
jgi:hypothetical protein